MTRRIINIFKNNLDRFGFYTNNIITYYTTKQFLMFSFPLNFNEYKLNLKRSFKFWFVELIYSLWPTIILGCLAWAILVLIGMVFPSISQSIHIFILLGVAAACLLLLINKYVFYKALYRSYSDFYFENVPKEENWKLFLTFLARFIVTSIVLAIPEKFLESFFLYNIYYQIVFSLLIQIFATFIAINQTLIIHNINISFDNEKPDLS